MYEARWMQREDYNQILVTPRMLLDHTPDSVVRVLHGLSIQYESSLSSTETQDAWTNLFYVINRVVYSF